MKLIAAVLALVTICQGVPSTYFGGRVVNGEDAKEGEFPYQVSVQTTDHFCGGTIYDKDHVVTAAHCFSGYPDIKVNVVAGTTDLRKQKSVHRSVKIIIHPRYNQRNSYVNDIAIVKVFPPFQESETVSFVKLPEQHAKVAPGAVAVVSGWGSLRVGGPSPDKLQRTEVMIATQEYCNKTNLMERLPIYDTQVCALDVNVETGPCHGDSGGPLMVDGELVGITSWAVNCASRVYPTVYTRVSEYLDWIKANSL